MSELVFEKRAFNTEQILALKASRLDNNPIVYILYNEKKKPTAYIGQTVQAARRLKNHLRDKKRISLTRTIFIGHERFHQSASYNIETNLINYFIAENHYQLQNVSQTRSREMHHYYQKEFYNEHLFEEIWNQLRKENIVSDNLENLRNKDIYKLSPYKELSPQQVEIKNEILDFCKAHIEKPGNHVISIEGDAGTGKSVLLSSLFNTIQDLSKDENSHLKNKNNYLLVNHGEMLKTYKSIANSLPNLKKKNLMKPTSFINQMSKTGETADIVLVDEAHLLLTKEDRYNNFHYQNQLEEIIKRSKITIVIFDPKQVLKIKSYWNERLLEEITNQYHAKTVKLTEQMRMNANPDTLKWINHFVSKQLLPLPQENNDTFQLKIFEDHADFKAAIEKKNNEVGLSRIVSTFDYIHKKDGATYMVDEEGINMPWNSTNDKWTWAEHADSIKEVGSIYTVQGFDLNYVGVILGPSVSYDSEKDELFIDTAKYKDIGAFTTRDDMSAEKIKKIKEEIILNSINVLMKRGINGLYIYATDVKLRNRLLELKRSRKK
ncbi:DUF2075 domain-containing protein [Bacillus subtilis]|uniref:DUF2075 domain-containing protein n=1 Tax=Bacillus subtilis TaxID=1423 RepID=UPI000FFE2601|nr:DUF2075 domain-containing protein [Bacillus subtilis]MEC2399537.1 DUF2075 domain-containing protein [Bacillus subtilis]MED4661138.1 DUF2075 domain-containing protein [Bacillus subtilis]MED4665742.1 DUF2075 domain-containing protein [Bacillus subtilis]QAT59853.1 DUF2075 domain-containing protein [Bacillus subtilis]QHM07850.1 hypothetical protein C7M27_03875 [Bacillus subtilis]